MLIGIIGIGVLVSKLFAAAKGKKDEGPGSSSGNASGAPAEFKPSYPYQADPAASVPELVQRCAGPQ